MGRPSVAVERRRQIIDATIRTIATHGITATTMDRIAEEAGMSRGHVRHFVGNREDLLVDVTRAFYAEDSIPGTILATRVTCLSEALDFLFSADFTAPGQENAVVLGLVEASRTFPSIGEIIREAYAGTQSALSSLLAAEAPETSAVERDDVAYGILTLALGNIFLADLGVPDEQTDVGRRAAEHLIDRLRSRYPSDPAGVHATK